MKYFFVFVLLLISNMVCFTQDTIKENNPITKSQLKTETDKLDYNKTKKVLKLKEQKQKTKEQKPYKKGPDFNFSGAGEIMKALLYIVFILFIGYVIYQIIIDYRIKNIDPNKKFELSENFEVDDIETLKIDPILDKALNQQNYRFAIRLKFLKVLQSLQELSLIKWKKDKTNKSYANEIDDKFNHEFKQIASLFDKVWYGHIDVSIKQYEYIDQKFDSFLDKVRQ